ncbi:MAG: hypothetical protein JNM98_06045 [Rhodocyclaceae bacterium]|nr:hypothetical protein [Rhodocyclaceae bacterium]
MSSAAGSYAMRSRLAAAAAFSFATRKRVACGVNSGYVMRSRVAAYVAMAYRMSQAASGAPRGVRYAPVAAEMRVV